MSLPWKTLLQKAGLAALSAAGAERWRVGEAMPGAILMLHRVRPASADPFQPNAFLEITPEFLDDVLGHLAAARIPVVSLDEAVERIGSANPGRFVVITLDDGYRDNLEHAFPVFQRHRAPFTIYIASGFVDGLANAWWLTLEAIIRGADTLRIPARGRPGRSCRPARPRRSWPPPAASPPSSPARAKRRAMRPSGPSRRSTASTSPACCARNS